MCGIVGIVGNKAAADRIYTALKRLEYRGYDSAGIATLKDNKRQIQKAVGKLGELGKLLDQTPLEGDIGIGHTRWATHGAPTVVNAHPHISGRVSVVHNGIIENYAELRDGLREDGYSFATETDTEVIAVLINHYLNESNAVEAFRKALGRLEGTFSLGVLIEGETMLLAARRGSPLAIGYGVGENYIGSDAIALASFTDRVTFLNDGDWAILTQDQVQIFDALGQLANREMRIINIDQFITDKGRHRHFMAKEIHDQPSTLSYVLSHYINDDRTALEFSGMDALDFSGATRISLVACGTAYLACFVAKYWIEAWARIPADVEIASEFRYREPPITQGHLVIFVSQSGETADTLAALQYAKSQGARTVALVNTEESTIGREADILLPLKAGAEISVASTKAFTAQLTVLALLSMMIAEAHNRMSASDREALVAGLTKMPRLMSEALGDVEPLRAMARELARAKSVLFLGRGLLYPLAVEAALKLKEITYIHAEGYASGELKHGPIALVDENLPIVVFAPSDALFEKVISNMEEVAARGGRVFLITDENGAKIAGQHHIESVHIMPKVASELSPLLYAVPAQLLAYFTALEKGTDVDQPRNLAKSVTVE